MSKKRNQKMTISAMYCTQCGKKGIDIPRFPSHQREAGHLKKLFCLYCGTETNHVEIRPLESYSKEDFEEEFQLGRFVNGERIPVAQLMSCSKTNCEYNRDGKCWNSNHSYKCNHRIIQENPNEETKNLLNRGW